MANRISECIAAIDGEELTKMIWTAQCHLDSRLNYHSSPYYEFTRTDELIVKTVLEIKAKHSYMTYSELERAVLINLQALYAFPVSISEEVFNDYISLLLANKLYSFSTFDQFITNEQKASLESFIHRHSLYKKLEDGCLSNQLRRITALYALAARMPKDLTQADLREATLAVYPLHKENPPHVPQAVYTFIAAELALMQNDQLCYSSEYVAAVIWNAYQEALLLPDLAEKKELLEIIIWKKLTLPKQILDKIPPCITQKVEEEIANALIDNPKQSFYYLLQVSSQLFKRLRELIKAEKWKEIEKKFSIGLLKEICFATGLKSIWIPFCCSSFIRNGLMKPLKITSILCIKFIKNTYKDTLSYMYIPSNSLHVYGSCINTHGIIYFPTQQNLV